MSWIDDYNDTDVLRAPDPKGWAESIGDFVIPNTMKWMRGEYAGRPESASGIGYEVLPEIGPMLGDLSKPLVNFGKNALNRAAMGKAIPQFAETMKELGNPITNTLKALKGFGSNVAERASSLVQPSGGLATAAAENVDEFATLPSKTQRLLSELKGSWGVEVPYNATDSAYPWAVIADETTLPYVRKGLGGGTREARGWSTVHGSGDKYLGDIIGILKDRVKTGTPIHEITHTANRRAFGYPGFTENLPTENIARAQNIVGAGDTRYAPRALRNALEDLAIENPKYTDALQGFGYNFPETGFNLGMGDELMARRIGRQIPELMGHADDAAFVDPNTWMTERVGSLVGEMTHPFFKQGMFQYPLTVNSGTQLPNSLYDYLQGME